MNLSPKSLSRNLCRRAPARLTLVLALAGLADSLYLGLYKLVPAEALYCATGQGCAAVSQSPYSSLLGIPNAIWGLALYGVLALLAGVELRRPLLGEALSDLRLLLAVAGTLFSVYLTGVALWVIGAVCSWCLLSLFLLGGITTIEALRHRRAPAAQQEP